MSCWAWTPSMDLMGELDLMLNQISEACYQYSPPVHENSGIQPPDSFQRLTISQNSSAVRSAS